MSRSERLEPSRGLFPDGRSTGPGSGSGCPAPRVHDPVHKAEQLGRDVRRGRMVNSITGEPASQLHERHDAGDFDRKTQAKLAAEKQVIFLW